MSKSVITLLDGGMGRELKRMGAPFRQPEWSALALIEAPEIVAQAHQAFVDAGSEVITTNNYAVAPFHLGQQRFNDEGEALTALSGEIARGVADRSERNVLVAGSIPPLYGSYRPDLFDHDAAPVELLKVMRALQPHADFWLAETMGSVAEFKAIVSALAQLDQSEPAKPFWASFTLEDEWVDGNVVLRSGETIAEAVNAVLDSPAEVLLFNCSQPEVISRAIEAASGVLADNPSGLRIGAYANAFAAPRTDDEAANAAVSELRGELTPELYQESFVAEWVEHGASIVGGCCGLGPEHIAALRGWVDRP